MSGFEPTWLALRDPADLAARDAGLLGAAIDLLASAPDPLCIDLGAGTGSTVRAFSAAGCRPRWRLVDNDSALLAEARRRTPSDFVLDLVEADLDDAATLDLAGARLVTASALFDLCSGAFIEHLAGRLADARLGLYAALTYDGTVVWEVPHPLDETVKDAFNAHQRRDKGFGPALGPGALQALEEAFGSRDFSVTTASSPWQLGKGQAALHRRFVKGMAQAVEETALLTPSDLVSWQSAREEACATSGCKVGHQDILALPAAIASADHDAMEPHRLNR